MASWMVHLRIADILLGKWEDVSPREFVMGSIAPDSGVPNEDWTAYSPDSRVTHFRITGEDGSSVIRTESIRAFADRYFNRSLREGYTKKEYAFFLGYWAHLIADVEWAQKVYRPSTNKFNKEFARDKQNLIRAMKRDWYDLDALYLKKHPDFRAFAVYEQAEGFVNRYMDIFSRDAFDLRRKYVVDFYRREMQKEDLEREYVYLTEAEADAFTERTAEIIQEKFAVMGKSA